VNEDVALMSKKELLGRSEGKNNLEVFGTDGRILLK
jgi:hypothetical protein